MVRDEFYPQPVRLYWETARRGYRRYAAYPAATWAGVFTNTVFGLMQAYILLAVFRRRDDVGGYDETDTLTYVWLAQAMLATVFMFGSRDLALRIRDGDIATDLARPVHPLWTGLASDYGRAVYHARYRGLPPFAVGAIVFDLEAPRSPLVWLAFVAAVALAVAVSYGVRTLYNLTAFWLLDSRGPATIATTTALFLSGFIVPLAFFPDWLRDVAYVTPFPSMLQVPVDIFIGETLGAGIAGAIAVQAGWAALLLGGCLAVYAAGVRRLVIQGG